tara:strand:+ start:8030 stop:12424 length:4395 start_codon:yes stop_codon:yes gene_type:complete
MPIGTQPVVWSPIIGEATDREMISAAAGDARLNGYVFGRLAAEQQYARDYTANFYAQTGVQLPDPYAGFYAPRATAQPDRGDEWFVPQYDTITGRHETFTNAAWKFLGDHPEYQAILQPPDMDEGPAQLMRDAEERLQRAGATRSGIANLTTGFIGSFGASLSDPIALASMLVGLGETKAGLSAAMAIVRAASREAVVNAATEAAVQPWIQANRKWAGLPYGIDFAIPDILFAAGGGAALGGLFTGGGRAIRAFADRGKVAPRPLPPEVRGAINYLDEMITIGESRPLGTSLDAHLAALSAASRIGEAGGPVLSDVTKAVGVGEATFERGASVRFGDGSMAFGDTLTTPTGTHFRADGTGEWTAVSMPEGVARRGAPADEAGPSTLDTAPGRSDDPAVDGLRQMQRNFADRVGIDPDADRQLRLVEEELARRESGGKADGADDAAGGFTTGKGSTYDVHADGTTTRNKAARNDVGHEGDSGPKTRSEKTVYIDGNAADLSSAGLVGSPASRVVIRDGKARLLIWNEQRNDWGWSSDWISFSTEPAVGRSPLELWKAKDDLAGRGFPETYGNMHAGNKIAEVRAPPPERPGLTPGMRQELIDRGLTADEIDAMPVDSAHDILAGSPAQLKYEIFSLYEKEGVDVIDREIADMARSGDGRTLAQTDTQAPPFFSAVLRGVEGVAMQKGKAAQWLGTIRNMAGIKAEELEWIGLEDWLKAQGDRVITRAEVAEFVAANQIEVKETVTTAVAATSWGTIAPPPPEATKFKAWTLTPSSPAPYRELLMTLPERPAPADNMRSAHWDDRNVLLHVRFVEREIGGRRVLHVEEIQSDWHQAGRKKGYAKPAMTPDDVDLRHVKSVVPEGHDPSNYPGYWESFDKLDGALIARHGGYLNEAAARAEALSFGQAKRRSDVPDAPFKTTWPELGMKRMIRWAAENNFDEIAWTPGKIQAERYSLAKQISRVRYVEVGNVKYLKAWDHSGKEVVKKPIINPEEELPEFIGKEVAERLLAAEEKVTPFLAIVKAEDLVMQEDAAARSFTTPDGRRTSIGRGAFRDEPGARASAVSHLNSIAEEVNRKRAIEGESVRELSGLDLKVGGEGMVGFYDKMLVNTANKLGKKFGVKAGLRDAPLGDGGKQVALHTLPINEEMKDAAMSGQALFQTRKGERRAQITLAQGHAIIELFAARDKSSFMHEASHLYLDELARDAALDDAPKQIKDDHTALMEWLGSKDYANASTKQLEKWAKGWERYMATGKAPIPSLQSAFDTFKEWMVSIYRSLRNIAPDVPPHVREIMDRMLSAGRALTDAERAGERLVFDDIKGKLVKAGMDEAEADINAAVFSARYSARAARLNAGRGFAREAAPRSQKMAEHEAVDFMASKAESPPTKADGPKPITEYSAVVEALMPERVEDFDAPATIDEQIAALERDFPDALNFEMLDEGVTLGKLLEEAKRDSDLAAQLEACRLR